MLKIQPGAGYFCLARGLGAGHPGLAHFDLIGIKEVLSRARYK